MNRTFWWASAALFVTLTITTMGLSSALRYKPPTPKGVPRDMPHEEVVKLALERAFPAQRAGATAVVEQAAYDFGMMDPNTAKAHTFLVRNEGIQPLRLGNPRTSCKCGRAELVDREIPSGESGRVNVFWNPGRQEQRLDFSVDVPTSDPENPTLVFRVTGSVRHLVFAQPSRISFTASTVESTPPTAQSVIYSQVWDDFTIDDVESSMPGLTWVIEPADASLLAEKQAVCGYLMTLHIPDDLPSGFATHWLRFRAAPADDRAEGEHYEIVIEGKVQGRIGIYANEIDEAGVIHLGVLKRGVERRVRLVVKVRDRDRELPNPRFRIEPRFVQASLTSRGEHAAGLYILDVLIPDDAPMCSQLQQNHWGKIELLTDHPRIPSHVMWLKFAVPGREQPILQ